MKLFKFSNSFNQLGSRKHKNSHVLDERETATMTNEEGMDRAVGSLE